jgi:putative phosphoribosyl transferase
VAEPELERLVAAEAAEVERLERAYRGDLPQLDLAGRTVILVDQGLARCWAMMAAVAAIQRRRPAHVVLAAPVGKGPICEELRLFADQVVVARRPDPFYKVRTWFDDEREPTDDEIRELVHLRAPHRRPSMAPWAAQVVRFAA